MKFLAIAFVVHQCFGLIPAALILIVYILFIEVK